MGLLVLRRLLEARVVGEATKAIEYVALTNQKCLEGRWWTLRFKAQSPPFKVNVSGR
jgi:hypothetical protein